jgi:hypothetical protein
VIAIDNTLIDHDGKLIEDAGWFWDHADQRHLIAHDYLIANYVCASGKHYPLEFRRFRKKEACVAADEPFKNHTILCKELIDWVVEQTIPGDFTFDSYFSNAEILNHIDSKQRNYVGDLKFNRTITVDGKDSKASEWAKTQLGPLCRRKTMVDGKQQWYFSKSIRIPGVRHTVRIVVLWKRQRDAEPPKILITNRTYWEVHRILKTYHKRWTIPETFHRDGKQHLGMGACQLRSGESQTRHMYLVFLAYSALMTQLRHDRALLLGSCTMAWSCRMRPSITVNTNGRAMTMAMVCGRFIATPVKGQVPRCAPSCGHSAACIKPTSTSTLRLTRRSSMPSRSHQP